MRIFIIPIAVMVTSFTVFAVSTFSQEIKQEANLTYFAGLLSAERDVRVESYTTEYQQREEKIKELLTIVAMKNADDSESGALTSSIHLLGAMRAKEAVIPLAQKLAFMPVRENRYTGDARTPSQMYYPAVSSLVKIGDVEATVKALTNQIGVSRSKKERELAAFVIMELAGKDDAVTVLSDAINRVGTEGRQHYEESVDYLQNFEPTLGPPPEYSS